NRYYIKKSTVNRLRPIRLIPPRGMMYDRYGKIPIVDNETAFDVLIMADKKDFLEKTDIRRQKALEMLGLKSEDIIRKINTTKNLSNEPIVVKENIDKDTVAYLAENNEHIPEFIIRVRSARRYESIAPHVIGYIGPVSEEDVKKGYAITDVKGKTGIEAGYEDYLKGNLGWKMVEVNTFGHIVHELPVPDDIEPGKNLYLTLDIELQKRAEQIMEGKTGSIVALDPRDGGILAMVSAPSFNPYVFINGNMIKERNQIMKDPKNPLLNRAIMGKYPPGSTFKIITATAALTEGCIDENTRYFCSGGMLIGNRWFKCNKPGGHGSVSIYEALPKSCNVFFYNTAVRGGLTVPLLHKYARMYGLGEKTGVDLPGEAEGYIPEKSTYPADRVNMSIGQGAILVTPLQMANVMSVIANHGFSYKPHVVNRMKLLHEKPEILVDLRDRVSINTIEIIRNSLRNVAKHGLNKEAKLKGIDTCGKTGTAQNPHGDEHSWFIGFAPFDNPKIVVAVLVENAGRGSEVAAPIAGQIFEQYLFGSKTVENNKLASQTIESVYQ
ncbi:MAG: penicillin-binding protein 2, partial [bacterium]